MCLHPNVADAPAGAKCPDCGVLVIRCVCTADDFRPSIEEHGDDPGPFDEEEEECPNAIEDEPEGEAMGAAVRALDLVRYVQVSGEAGELEALAARTAGRGRS